MRQINSGKIVWNQTTIDDLRRKLAAYQDEVFEDENGDINVDFVQDYEDDVENYSDPAFDETDQAAAVETQPVVVAPVGTPIIQLEFPWPITVKSSTFVVAAQKTVGVDTVLTWDDIVGVDNYEVRLVMVG